MENLTPPIFLSDSWNILNLDPLRGSNQCPHQYCRIILRFVPSCQDLFESFDFCRASEREGQDSAFRLRLAFVPLFGLGCHSLESGLLWKPPPGGPRSRPAAWRPRRNSRRVGAAGGVTGGRGLAVGGAPSGRGRAPERGWLLVVVRVPGAGAEE